MATAKKPRPTPADKGRICANCEWFVPPPSGSGPGECRRFPRYEQKVAADWCGEFKGG